MITSDPNTGQTNLPSNAKEDSTPQQCLTAPSDDWIADLQQTTRSKKRSLQHLSDSDYGSLSQESLIAIIRDLQAENKTLLSIVERTTAVSSSQTTIPPATNVTSTEFTFSAPSAPKKSSTPKKDKDFPTLKAAESYVSKAKKGQQAPSGKTKKITFQKNSAEAKKWAISLFSTPDSPTNPAAPNAAAPPTGFTFVYLPSKRKTPQPQVRDRLRIIGVNLRRVYHISHPAKNVLALLVHKGYADEVYSLASLAGISLPNKDFNPTSGHHIGNPKLLDELTPAQLDDKAKALYYNRILQATAQLPNPKFGLFILKDFNLRDASDPHFVPDSIIEQYIKLRPSSIQKRHVTSRASLLRGFDASQLFDSLPQDTSATPSRTTSKYATTGNTNPNPSPLLQHAGSEDTQMDVELIL